MSEEKNSWKRLKMENLGEVVSGGTPKTDSPNFWNGNINWITPTDVTALKGKKYISETNRKITEEGLKNSSANLLPIGTLIICTRATIGDSVINKVPISTNQGFKSLITKSEVSSEFMYYWILSNKNELIKQSSGSTFLELSTKSFKNLDVLIPPLPEQQKIAEILSTVDAKIEVIDQQITETQALKKGLMQRLLTKGIGHTEFKDSPLGEIPKSWEVVRSSEVFELIHGYQFRDYDFTENGLPIVKIGQINRNGELEMKGCSFFSSDRAEEFEDKRIFNGDVLMALTGATLGKSCWVDGLDNPVYQNYRVGKFVPHDEKILSKQFLYFLIGSPLALDQILAKVNSGAQGNVGKSDFEKLKITLPPIAEQNKIAQILRTVDDKLNVLLGKKTHYQDLKQGLMQQLLTGKIRVNVNIN